MTAKRWLPALSFVAMLGLVFTATAHAATIVKVTLTDQPRMAVKPSRTKVKTGKVTFDVTNLKSSASRHEMIVARLTPAEIKNVDSMPYNDEQSRVEENKITDLGEVSELQPGHSGSLTIEMTPGTYLLFCNVPGHFRAGMRVFFKVTK